MTQSHGMILISQMLFETGKYYHFYNRTNNKEPLFHEKENYIFFLSKFQKQLSQYCSVLTYCLMPTHFHFLIKIETSDRTKVSNAVAVLLRSYTRAINKRFNRTGNLFQQNSKAIEITDEKYLIVLTNYIHQNPIRAGLVKHLDDWNYSSYKYLSSSDAMTESHGITINKEFYKYYFKSDEEFVRYSEALVQNIKKEYWV